MIKSALEKYCLLLHCIVETRRILSR